MVTSRRAIRYAAALLLGLAAVAGRGGAQPPAKATAAATANAPVAASDSTVRSIEAFAKLQRALNGLRDREQAELAEPRNKKVDAQAEIRARYRRSRADSLAAHGYTPAAVSAMTWRLSSDDALRALFETTMERLAK